MKRSPTGSLLKTLAKFSLVAATALGLNGCGGGSGGGGDAGPAMVAPASLDAVTLNFFNAFSLECFRLSGSRGNEFGTIRYRSQGGFQFSLKDSSNTLTLPVALPNDLTDVRYSYLRTGANSGRLEMTWSVVQGYPFPTATQNNTTVRGTEMFWFGSDPGAGLGEQRLVVDLLFAANGAVLGDQIARVTEAISYLSVFLVGESYTGFAFDTPDLVSFRTAGGQVPVDYDPYDQLNQNTPVNAVWTSLRRRIVDFTSPGSGAVLSRMSFLVDPSANPPPLPSGAPEESGRVLLSDFEAGVQDRDGEYSYRRTGGDRAMLTVRFEGPAPGRVIITKNYDLDFESLEAGVFFESTRGVIGDFEEDRFLPGG